MKPLEKLTKAQFISFCLMAFCSGVMIGIGGTAFLLACSMNIEEKLLAKLIGAVLFSLGILCIVMFDMKLFTGLISYIPEMGAKNLWKLPVCFLGNMLGVLFASILVYFSPLAEVAQAQSTAIMTTKLSADLWGIKALCSGALCGFLITLSIGAVKYAPRKGLSTTVGVMFPIIVFAFCGFDHSVANTLYIFFHATRFSGNAIPYLLLCVAGNILGGVILPILSLFRTWSEQPRKEEKNETVED